MLDRPVYHFDADRLDALIRAKCRTDNRFIGTTIAERARMCDVSETTYKSIVSGRNPAPRLDIIYNIVATFGGSIDALVGIDVHNGVQEAAGGAQSAETDKYREMYHQSEARAQAAEKRLSDRDASLERRTREVYVNRRIAVGFAALCAVICACVLIAYMIWEFDHMDSGLTGALRRMMGMLK